MHLIGEVLQEKIYMQAVPISFLPECVQIT